MVEKIGFIRNPLTIIAIFAGIAEVSGSITLTHLSESIQFIYVWFLIGFPSGLVLLFFLTLLFKHKVLYAPSDFKDERNFMNQPVPASAIEREATLREKVREAEEEQETTEEAVLPKTPPMAMDEMPVFSRRVEPKLVTAHVRDVSARYLLAEELVLNKIAKEQGMSVHRQVKLGSYDINHVFDGAIIKGSGNIVVIEIKYVDRMTDKRRGRIVREVSNSIVAAGSIKANSVYLILAVVTESKLEDEDLVKNQIASALMPALSSVQGLAFTLRTFDLATLQNELASGISVGDSVKVTVTRADGSVEER